MNESNSASQHPQHAASVASGHADLIVPGMGSDHCAGLVSESIKRLSGISDVSTNIAKIIENLFWAWFYSLAAIPIAAIGLLRPMVGVVAMTISSLSVIGNSLRLKRVQLKVS